MVGAGTHALTKLPVAARAPHAETGSWKSEVRVIVLHAAANFATA